MNKTRMVALISFIMLCVIGVLSQNKFAVGEISNGVVSIAFDDGWENQYQYAYPLLQQRGMVGVFYVISGDVGSGGSLTEQELIDLQAHGNEIASHSVTHPDFTTLSTSQIQSECQQSKATLESYGLTINNFAYPFGASNPEIDNIVKNYYHSARYDWNIMTLPHTEFQVTGWSSYEDTDAGDFTAYKEVIDEIVAEKGWCILYFHGIEPNNSLGEVTSVTAFAQVLDYIQSKGIQVLTVEQALNINSLTATISPLQVRMYVGQSQTFSSSVSGGTPPYAYQWYLNDSVVPGATGSTWTFTPTATGHLAIYLNVTDDLGFRVKSNVVDDVSVSSVYLLLTVEPNQGPYSEEQLTTFTVSIFNGLNPALESTLSLTVTGPGGYGYYDFQPIQVAANTVSEFSFTWVFPNVSGKYVVEVELVPSLLTAYDAAWLEAA